MTLSAWFRSYLFSPLLMMMMTRVGTAKSAPYLGAVAFFVTFLIMGVWHGSTPSFVVYGLFLGFGATWTSFWQIWAAKLLGRASYKKLCAQPRYFQFSRALTLSYFAVALTCLWISPQGAISMAGPYGLCLAALAIATMTVFGAVLGSLASAFLAVIRRKSKDSPWSELLAMAAVLLMINLIIGSILFIAIRNGAPISLPHLAAALVVLSVTLVGCVMACGLMDRAIVSPAVPRAAPIIFEAWMAFRIFIVLALSVQLTTAVPEFIYRAF
jgi:hypothetical protein